MAIMMTEKILEERLRLNPDSLAFSRLADIHRKAGNISRAIALCTKGVEQHPAYVTGRIILGRCYLEKENLDNAVDAFTNVCKIDRRNIVAIKMLADIFMRQGLQEKAGDLYALLAKMDPYNEMLIRNASQVKGKGSGDLFEILGISVEPMSPQAPGAPVSDERVASQPEPDVTVTQIAAPQELGIEQPPAPSQQQVDVTGATEVVSDVDVDKVIAEAAEITGSDITERMTEMFGEREKAEKEPLMEALDETPAEPLPSVPAAEEKETPVEETIEVEPLAEVPDGSTITSRIDQLFGRDTIKMPPIQEVPKEEAALEKSGTAPSGETAFEETMILDADAMKMKIESTVSPKEAEAGEEVSAGREEEQERAQFEAEASVMEPDRPVGADSAVEELVVDEKDGVEELFKGIDEPAMEIFEPSAPGSVESSEEKTLVEEVIESSKDGQEIEVEDTISGDDVAERIDTIFKKKEEQEQKVSVVSQEEEPVAERSDRATSVGESGEAMLLEELVVDDTGPKNEEAAPMPAGVEDAISGDDVVERLEGIFEKKKDTERKAEPEKPPQVSLGTQTEGIPEKPEEATVVVTPVEEAVAEQKKEPDARDEAVIELVADEQEDDGTIASSDEDILTGEDVARRLEGIFEKRQESPPEPGTKKDVSMGSEAAIHDIQEEPEEGSLVFEPRTKEDKKEPAGEDEALIEILAKEEGADETATSPYPSSEDTITGDDVAERLEGMFEKRKDTASLATKDEHEPAAAPVSEAPTEFRDETVDIADSVIETVGIITGDDVEERLTEFFPEDKPDEGKQPSVHRPDRTSGDEAIFEPSSTGAKELEETLIAGDLSDLLPDHGRTPTERKKTAIPEDIMDEVDEQGEIAETMELFPAKDEGTAEKRMESERSLRTEADIESTAVFEEFMPGSVPNAPKPPPDVPVFLTGKDMPADADVLFADIDKSDTSTDIPDHVLTPTLADLYFQQGQPQLSLSIYRRLLEKSGSNERYEQRIAEIEKIIADGGEKPQPVKEPLLQAAPKPKKKGIVPPRRKAGRVKRSEARSESDRPLAGVKLKKRPKLQWRKKAGEKKAEDSKE